MKKLFVSQSNYIPWRGFFDAINYADEYVVYDEMQFSKNSWRNRNKILTAAGPQWLTVPVQQKGRFGQPICEVETSEDSWREKHWKTILQNYSKTKFFNELKPQFESLYLKSNEKNLTQINVLFLKVICKILEIKTKISDSREYNLKGDRIERLVGLCQQTQSEIYCSSPTAKVYLDEAAFNKDQIEVFYFDFEGYPQYDQGQDAFYGHLSILDVLFRYGKEARNLTLKHSVLS